MILLHQKKFANIQKMLKYLISNLLNHQIVLPFLETFLKNIIQQQLQITKTKNRLILLQILREIKKKMIVQDYAIHPYIISQRKQKKRKAKVNDL